MNCPELNDIEGLKFMPVTLQKRPVIKNWQHSTGVHNLDNCEGVGLVCGKLSGNLEVLDCDEKYSLDGKLFVNYKRLIHAADNTLLAKLLVQTTKGGGYHMIYRCSEISGNLKLANRRTTQEERDYTYQETYKAALSDPKNKSDDEARLKAKKASENDKVRVLLETRGEGGYIMCFPSKGYELVNLDFYGINEITPEQRNILHTCARELNEVFEEVIVPKTQQSPKQKGNGLSPFEDYDQRGDITQLLTSHGWKFVKNKGNKVHFQRPGQTSAETSGNYDTANGWFSVFTTSTEFDTNHGYRPYAVFAVLECNKDFSLASKKLYEMGYGERNEKPEKEKSPSTRVIQSRVDPNDNDLSFLATPKDYDDYLQQVIDGTLPMGLTTGSPKLDEHFLFKKGEFVMDNGHDNTGKSIFVWYLELLAALYHGWKGIIFSSENTLGAFMRKMIQFYWGKPIRGYGAMSREEYFIAKDFIEKHFILIKAQEDLYNYKDILNMVKKALKAHPNLNFGMIDPYNSLKTDLSGFSKLSTHEYHYEALSELKSFGQVNNFGWFINHHAITEALRRTDKDGYPVAPNKADTEGGGKVSNKADSFLTIHRKTQHPEEWNVTEVHVRKIKDTETGGRPTPMENPIRFKMTKNGCGFEEYLLEGGYAVNPVARWHQTRTATCEEEKHWADRKDYQTFEQFKEQEQSSTPVVPITSAIPSNYEPDDEEKAALEELMKKDAPF